jgi:1,4-alpha-glucan branching enzyme
MTTTARTRPRTPSGRTRTKAAKVATAPLVAPASPLTDFDLYLFNEGTHVRIYQKLGAHLVTTEDGRTGVSFGVWAPNADAVSVIGDFNSWNPEATPLQARGSSGIWEGFVPDLGQGTLYKFSLRPRFAQHRVEKADPYGFAAAS